MRGEKMPYIWTAYTGLMGDRIYGLVVAEGDESHPWHTGRDQKDLVLYKANYQPSKEVLLPHVMHILQSQPWKFIYTRTAV
jgi:hypothetical protein